MNKPKLDDNAPKLAKELDKIFPTWIEIHELESLIRAACGYLPVDTCAITYTLNRGIILEKKVVLGRSYIRLSGYCHNRPSHLDTAKRRVKTDPASAFISLPYSEFAKRFHK